MQSSSSVYSILHSVGMTRAPSYPRTKSENMHRNCVDWTRILYRSKHHKHHPVKARVVGLQVPSGLPFITKPTVLSTYKYNSQ
jgi:hypothetical protein